MQMSSSSLLLLIADANPDTSLLSLTGSAMALASTFWFWMVRANKERPSLHSYLVRPLSAHWPMRVGSGGGDGTVVSRYQLDLAVANYSSLPNAMIGFGVQVKMPDGSWRALRLDLDSLPVPANIGPMSTCGITLVGDIDVPGSLSGTGNREREVNAHKAIARPPQFRVEIHALGGKSFATTIVDHHPHPLDD
ncbi:MAG: hypothetical protein AB7K09_22775 [Planctomycetota bacterium]